ncbi:hypothetical protein SDC9_26441 [bioreactor metagenome]|uniref:Uncharacterized protein n=1 Tax=bioreactor metagenome TaxID=1076179 RepID=A0A644UNH0_9ZZZZ
MKISFIASRPFCAACPSARLRKARQPPCPPPRGDPDGQQEGADDQQRERRGQRAERIDHRLRHIRRHPEDLERQGVVAARGQERAGELVIAEREAEQRHPHHRGEDDRQHDMGKGLPGAGTLVARRLLIGGVEAVEDREHHQKAEGQRPGQLRTEARGRPVHLQPEAVEDQPDAQRDKDRGDHQRGDGQIEQRRRAAETLAEGKPRHHRDHHGRHHHHQPEHEGTAERAPDIAHRLLLEQVVEPIGRGPVHREGQPAFRPLEGQDRDGDRRAVKEDHEQHEDGGEHVEAARTRFHVKAPCGCSRSASARR